MVVVVDVRPCRENVIRVVRKSKLAPYYFHPRHLYVVMLSWTVFFKAFGLLSCKCHSCMSDIDG